MLASVMLQYLQQSRSDEPRRASVIVVCFYRVLKGRCARKCLEADHVTDLLPTATVYSDIHQWYSLTGDWYYHRLPGTITSGTHVVSTPAPNRGKLFESNPST